MISWIWLIPVTGVFWVWGYFHGCMDGIRTESKRRESGHDRKKDEFKIEKGLIVYKQWDREDYLKEN